VNEKPATRDASSVFDYFRNGVEVRDGEPVEYAIKRFKKEVANAGTLTELKKREYYVKPSVTRKLQKESAVRKRMKKKMMYGNE